MDCEPVPLGRGALCRGAFSSPLRWSSDPSWKLDYSNIERLSPEEIRRRRREFDRQKEIARTVRGEPRMSFMPGGMNGVQLAVEARRIRPELKVLLTSGYTATALSREHGLPDNLNVVEKPYQREELAKKLKLVIGG